MPGWQKTASKISGEKVRKASNPDQLTQFVTSFKLSTISDEKRSIAKNQADGNEKFVPPRDDIHRPENPAKWLCKESFRTNYKRKQNFDLRVDATKSLGKMMILLRDPPMPKKRIRRRPWVNRVSDQCTMGKLLSKATSCKDQAGSNGIIKC